MRKLSLLAFAIVSLFMTVSSLCAAPAPRLRIITTTFPLYDWTRQILVKHVREVELIQLQDNGIDLHNFQPTVRDIARISQCDLFIFVGGESDEWVEKALRSPRNTKRITLNLIKELGDAVQEEEPLEGMEGHALHHHHDHDKKHDHDEDEHETDEHIWLSLRCATTLCRVIAAKLSELDKTNAAEYQANCGAYSEKLLALDKSYMETVAASARKTLLFADRYPFRYMANDYGLTCFAAFSGCSAETEASFKTIAFLARKVDECKLRFVLVLENRQHRIAETVVRTAKSKGVGILTLDSLQATTSRDAANGKSYLNVMEMNLAILKKALGN